MAPVVINTVATMFVLCALVAIIMAAVEARRGVRLFAAASAVAVAYVTVRLWL